MPAVRKKAGGDRARHWSTPFEAGKVMSQLTPAERLVDALRRRQVVEEDPSAGLYPDQAELLSKFDAASLGEKREMLGDLWPKWRDYVVARYGEADG